MKELSSKQLKRRDRQDLKYAGAYYNGKDHYLDDDGYPRTDIEIPAWFHNMTKAWKAKKIINLKRKRMDAITFLLQEEKDALLPATLKEWKEYCDERISHGFTDPRDKKIVNRIKRSDTMRELLALNGVVILEDNTIEGYDGWTFMPNGRLKCVMDDGEELKYSVYWFINNMI